MAWLTENNKEQIKEALYQNWGSCLNCPDIAREHGQPHWFVPHENLGTVLTEIVVKLGLSADLATINHDLSITELDINDLVKELKLKCPNCGSQWTTAKDEIGKHLEYFQ